MEVGLRQVGLRQVGLSHRSPTAMANEDVGLRRLSPTYVAHVRQDLYDGVLVELIDHLQKQRVTGKAILCIELMQPLELANDIVTRYLGCER
jgi:hypothetical protein